MKQLEAIACVRNGRRPQRKLDEAERSNVMERSDLDSETLAVES